MSDIFFPPDLVPATMMFGIDDFTAVDESATTGGMQSSALYGTRRWHLRMDFPVLSGSQLRRFEAIVAALRGRANRVWINPTVIKLRGSFPAVELFTNNDFSGGTTGWSTDTAAQYTIAAIDRGVRATRAKVTSNAFALMQTPALLNGIPYALRGFLNAGSGSLLIDLGGDGDGNPIGTPPISQGMLEGGFTQPSASSPRIGFFDPSASGMLAGSYFDAKWASLSRCAQVDNGVNLLLNSDTPGTGTGWTLQAGSASSAAASGPDGALDAWAFFETTANSAHDHQQSITVPAAAADYSISELVFAGNRTWCYLQAVETLGGTNVQAFFNMSTGAVGVTAVGANFTLISAITRSYGAGWFRVILTFRKTNAATTLTAVFGPASANGTALYVGVATPAAMFTWRASLAPSSVPVMPVATAGVAQSGTLQTGFSLNLKGLPVSSQGLLLDGDVVEIDMPVNSQLVRAISQLDSDAAGLGTLMFENMLKQSPVDGAAVIVQQPMGRFALATSTLGIEYSPGVFGQASLEFVEAA